MMTPFPAQLGLEAFLTLSSPTSNQANPCPTSIIPPISLCPYFSTTIFKFLNTYTQSFLFIYSTWSDKA